MKIFMRGLRGDFWEDESGRVNLRVKKRARERRASLDSYHTNNGKKEARKVKLMRRIQRGLVKEKSRKERTREDGAKPWQGSSQCHSG